jgi:hypothetical protein
MQHSQRLWKLYQPPQLSLFPLKQFGAGSRFYLSLVWFSRQFDVELCQKDSCLGCKQLDPEEGKKCPVFRAQYERKKRDIQMDRYEQGKDQALAKESSELTEEQLSEMLLPHLKELLSERTGELSVDKMRHWLELALVKKS